MMKHVGSDGSKNDVFAGIVSSLSTNMLVTRKRKENEVTGDRIEMPISVNNASVATMKINYPNAQWE